MSLKVKQKDKIKAKCKSGREFHWLAEGVQKWHKILFRYKTRNNDKSKSKYGHQTRIFKQYKYKGSYLRTTDVGLGPMFILVDR